MSIDFAAAPLVKPIYLCCENYRYGKLRARTSRHHSNALTCFANAILGGSEKRIQLVVNVEKIVASRQRPEMHNEMSKQTALAMKHKKIQTLRIISIPLGFYTIITLDCITNKSRQYHSRPADPLQKIITLSRSH